MNFKLVLSSLTFILVLFLIFNKEDVAETQIFKGNIMGTSYNITLQSDVSGEDAQEGFRAYMSEKELGECVHCEGFDG